MRTLVTGAAGFIGSCFVRRALRDPSNSILALDKLTYAGNREALPNDDWDPERFVFQRLDINERAKVLAAILEFRPQRVVHFAAESHVDRSINSPLEFVETNVTGTCNLLLAVDDYWRAQELEFKQRFRFLHVSTDEVYGSLGKTGKFTETTAYDPRSPYAASKAASDHFVRAWHHTYGLPVIITNCSNNYGPYQNREKLIPLMICNAILGKPLPIYGDGKNVRDWLFAEDHCEALERILDAGQIGATYNIGGNCEKTNVEVVTAICERVQSALPELSHDCKALMTFVDDRPGHDWRYAMDTAKIERELDWRPTTNFEDGLQTTVQWYIDELKRTKELS